MSFYSRDLDKFSVNAVQWNTFWEDFIECKGLT